MSRIHAKAASILVDEFDFSGISNSVDIDLDNAIADVTAFADAADTFVEGVKANSQITVGGFISFTSPAYEGEMFTDLTAESRRVGIYPPGVADGNFGFEATTIVGGQERTSNLNQAAALNVTWRSTAPLIRTTVLDKDVAVAASGNGTAYQVGAVGATETLVGVLRVLATPLGAGNNTLDIIVQRDNAEGMGTPETALTFTQLTQDSVALFEVQTQAGAITDDWYRVSYTYAGVGSRTFDVIVVLGIRPT